MFQLRRVRFITGKKSIGPGNSLVSEFTLSGLLAIKQGDVADGMQIEAGWDRIREEYAHRGYLEAKLDPQPAYDDQAHTVSYAVSIQEGLQFHFGKMVPHWNFSCC